MICPICESLSMEVLFEKSVLNKYQTSYLRCARCEFMCTESPHWLGEAYQSAITSLDLGLLNRNLRYKPLVSNIFNFIVKGNRYLDYAGGYGVFTRLMRDKGFNYFSSDPYCANLFSKDFDIDLKKNKFFYDGLTAFEVFEHLEHPLDEIEKMLKLTSNLIFSTELQPKDNLKEWSYIAPETGQHIAFYTKKTLMTVATKFKLNFYTDGKSFHMFSTRRVNSLSFKILTSYKSAYLIDLIFGKRASLLVSDFEKAREKLKVS